MIFSSLVSTPRSCLLTHGHSSAMSRLCLLMQTNTPQSRHQRHVVLRVDREGDFVTRELSSGVCVEVPFPVLCLSSFLFFFFFLKLLPVCPHFSKHFLLFSRHFHLTNSLRSSLHLFFVFQRFCLFSLCLQDSDSSAAVLGPPICLLRALAISTSSVSAFFFFCFLSCSFGCIPSNLLHHLVLSSPSDSVSGSFFTSFIMFRVFFLLAFL